MGLDRPIDITAEQRKTILTLLDRYLPNITTWVYGSRAKWTSRPQSDLDMVVFTTSEQNNRVSDLREAFEESDLPFQVYLFVWDSVPESFREHVRRDHVVLVEREEGEQLFSVLPEDWKQSTLGEVIELKRGYDLPKHKRTPGPVPIVSSSGPTDSHSESKVRGPGVVTGRYGTLGQVFFISKNFWPLNTSLYVRDFKGNDPRFISYFLRGIDFSAYSDKAAVPGLNRNHLHQEIVRIPTNINEQRAIAHILGTLDDKIELNRRMNETLEEMARALFKSWFVDFDPVHAKAALRNHTSNPSPLDWTVERARAYLDGMDPSIATLFPARLVDSELGEVPEGWEVGTLNDMLELLSGGTPKTSIVEYWDGNIPWYTAKDAPPPSDVFVVETERKITQAGIENSAAKMLPAGTTVITARGTVGRLACLGIPMTMNQTCYGIRGVQGYPDFFTYMNIKMTVNELQQRTHGTIFDTITRQTFKLIDAIILPPKLADKFETVVQPIMSHILSNLHESRALTALRDTLLPKLISGEVRVDEKATYDQLG